MIPVKLILQGLYSYQKREEIDFRKLTESHLFGIFGPVGSGKSSILDAISFVLYGETERMNSRENRNYNMMNLKSDQLFIEFDFITGKEGTTYRSVVKGKRNSKRFDDVKPYDRAAYKFTNNEWIPIEIEGLQAAIGLSYENFKRAIIIPQGKFQEFLQLGNSDRTKMMRELFNLGKFELSGKVATLESKNNQQLQLLQGKLQQLGDIKPEQIEEAENRLKELNETLLILNQEFKLKDELNNQLEQLKSLCSKLHIQQAEVEKLLQQEGSIQKSEQLLKEYETCLINFLNLFEQSDDSKRKVDNLKITIGKEQKRLDDSILEYEILAKEFDTVQSDYGKKDIWKQQSVEFKKIGRIIELTKGNERIEERINNGNKICTELSKKTEESITASKDISDSIQNLKSTLPDLVILSQIKEWFTIHKGYLNELQNIKKEIENTLEEIKVLNGLIGEEVNKKFPDFGLQLILPENHTDFLQKEIEKHIKELEIAGNEIEHLLIQDRLEEFSTSLMDGHPCPLCGSNEHPNPLKGGDVKIELQRLRESIQKSKKGKELAQQLLISIGKLEVKISEKQETIIKLEDRSKLVNDKLLIHNELFTWSDYSDEQFLDKAFQLAKSVGEQLKLKEKELAKVQGESEKGQIALKKYQLELEKIREEFTKNSSEISTLSMQIENLILSYYLSESVGQINQQSDNLLQKAIGIEASYQRINAELNTLGRKKEEISGKMQVYKANLTETVQNDKNLDSQIEESLSKSAYNSKDQVKAILNLKIDIEPERKRIQDFRQTLLTARALTDSLADQIGDRQYISEEHLKLTQELGELKRSLDNQNRELGISQAEIIKLKKDIEQLKEIRKQLDDLELRAEDLKTLKQLFKGSGFVNYISTVHLQNLCRAANDRFFKLARQRMALELTEDNNFQVRDFMNGGKIRSVKTLSGGQTFQAALSLALALADSIQHFTDSAQNFFFLDEGFGSLDKESLDIVFDTLKSLRKESRIVGVISHVEEMQQEITTHLKIVNDEMTGSHIIKSWQ